MNAFDAQAFFLLDRENQVAELSQLIDTDPLSAMEFMQTTIETIFRNEIPYRPGENVVGKPIPQETKQAMVRDINTKNGLQISVEDSTEKRRLYLSTHTLVQGQPIITKTNRDILSINWKDGKTKISCQIAHNPWNFKTGYDADIAAETFFKIIDEISQYRPILNERDLEQAIREQLGIHKHYSWYNGSGKTCADIRHRILTEIEELLGNYGYSLSPEWQATLALAARQDSLNDIAALSQLHFSTGGYSSLTNVWYATCYAIQDAYEREQEGHGIEVDPQKPNFLVVDKGAVSCADTTYPTPKRH